MLLTLVAALGLMSCASEKTDSAKPTAKPAGFNEKPIDSFTAKDGGYKQDDEGNWLPNSTKRSSYDSASRRESSIRGKVSKQTYKTGDYKKKSWLGGKKFKSDEYAGNTDGSRFQTRAKQDGKAARGSGQSASEGGLFQTKTLDNQRARESRTDSVSRGSSDYVESARGSYQAPSIIDWRAQRTMSQGQSRSILGR